MKDVTVLCDNIIVKPTCTAWFMNKKCENPILIMFYDNY